MTPSVKRAKKFQPSTITNKTLAPNSLFANFQVTLETQQSKKVL